MKEYKLTQQQLEDLAKGFKSILENRSEEKKKEIIELLPFPELRKELKNFYNID